MSFSFADLRKSQGNLEAINKAAKALNKGNYDRDERMWRPVRDKAGEGSATIRFLPGPGEEIPFVKKYSYSFKDETTGLWLISNSPSTLGLPDPVMEHNSKMWNSGDEGKEIARKRKRKLGYISNIEVIRHKGRPEDEGKTFLYEYGQKIFGKLQAVMQPDDDEDKPMNPFCLFTGAPFRLRIKNVSGFPNYDDSSFDRSCPAADSDEKLEVLWKKTYSLQAEIAPDKFPSFDELQKKFYRVIGLDTDNSERRSEPVREAVAAPSTAAQFESRRKDAEAPKAAPAADDADDDFFSSLAD